MRARTASERFDERKHPIAEHDEFAFGVEILEARPTQIALIGFKNGILNRFAK